MAKRPGNVRVIDRDRGYKAIMAEVKKLNNSYTSVGVHKGVRRSDSSIDMAQLAHIHEFGININVTDRMRGFLHYIGIHLKPSTGQIRIPSRPFMRSWADGNRVKLGNFAKGLYLKVLSNAITAERALGLLGEFGVSGLQKNFTAGEFQPLHPATIANRENGGTRPLVDTGQLRNSITHVEYMGRKPE